MRHREEFGPIIQEIEYLLAIQRRKETERPRLIVVHGRHQPETNCLRGEIVEQSYLAYETQQIPLRLSPRGLLVIDCLSRHRGTPVSAAQIERILARDPFYQSHAANVSVGNKAPMMPKRASIKVYVQRIRVQIGRALEEMGLNIKPERILESETTDSNAVVYRIKVSVEVRHNK